MGPRGWLPAIAAAVACAAIVFGATTLVRSHPVDPDREIRPTPVATDEPHPVSVVNYLVADTALGPRLFAEQVNTLAVPGREVAAAIEAVVAGTTTDRDYRSAFPAGTTAKVKATSEGTMLIDLRGIDPQLDYGQEGALAIEALNRALTAADAPSERIIAVNGRPVQTLLGQSTTSEMAPDSAVMAPLWITAPLSDDAVGTSFAVTGQATTADGQVRWQVARDQRVVRKGVSHVGDDGRSFNIQISLPPGTYEVRVEGRPATTPEIEGGMNSDTKEFTVR